MDELLLFIALMSMVFWIGLNSFRLNRLENKAKKSKLDNLIDKTYKVK